MANVAQIHLQCPQGTTLREIGPLSRELRRRVAMIGWPQSWRIQLACARRPCTCQYARHDIRLPAQKRTRTWMDGDAPRPKHRTTPATILLAMQAVHRQTRSRLESEYLEACIAPLLGSFTISRSPPAEVVASRTPSRSRSKRAEVVPLAPVDAYFCVDREAAPRRRLWA